jgi:hypothetical protein
MPMPMPRPDPLTGAAGDRTRARLLDDDDVERLIAQAEGEEDDEEDEDDEEGQEGEPT